MHELSPPPQPRGAADSCFQGPVAPSLLPTWAPSGSRRTQPTHVSLISCPPKLCTRGVTPRSAAPAPTAHAVLKVPVLPDGLDGRCSVSAFNIHVSTYLLLKVPGFRRCLQAFSSCGEWGLLSPAVTGVSLWGVSWCGEWASAVAVPRLSCPKTHRIFPDQRLNPCPLHWQVDAQPRGHQGSPAAS